MPARREAATCSPKPSQPANPAPSTPPNPHNLYRTQNTNFGSYILAAEKLRFRGAEPSADSTGVELVFFDPEGIGPDLQRRFNVGAVDSVNARVLFETRGYLMAEVKRIQAGVNNAQR
jgi:hypothetical protein